MDNTENQLSTVILLMRMDQWVLRCTDFNPAHGLWLEGASMWINLSQMTKPKLSSRKHLPSLDSSSLCRKNKNNWATTNHVGYENIIMPVYRVIHDRTEKIPWKQQQRCLELHKPFMMAYIKSSVRKIII